MGSAAIKAKGTKLQYADDAAGPYTDVAQVLDISGPNRSKNYIDITSHDSDSDYREEMAAIRDGGELTLQLNWDPALSSHAALETNFAADTNKYWRVVAPTTLGHYRQFQGQVSSLGDSYPVQDKLALDVTIKVIGAVTNGTE